MIRLLPVDTTTDPALIDRPGAFLWWYMDLVGAAPEAGSDPRGPSTPPPSKPLQAPLQPDAGRGLVLIWSWALPFLPGLNSEAKAGRPVVPRTRPSLNIAAYEGGKEHGYLFQEYPAERCRWERPGPGHMRWHFGDSVLEQTRENGRLALRIQLDCAIPGTERRLRGQVRLDGALRQNPPAVDVPLDGPTSHGWSPLSVVASAAAELDIGGHAFHLRGRGYHDRNAAEVPLDQLGIAEWWWGRLAFADREVIWYRLRPDSGGPLEEAVLTVFADGSCRLARSEMVLAGARRSIWGLSHPRSLRFRDHGGAEIAVDVAHRVDDGPFYQRFLVEGRREGQRAHGVAEYVVPDRCDRPLMRPLVRMRVHKEGGENHSMAPFFAGSVLDRIERTRATMQAGG